jgi:tetratricopeptide (TPR) repeat protein
MKKYFTILLIGISFLSYSQKKPSKSKKTINYKVVDMNTQAKKEIIKYDKIINQDPNNAEAYYNRGFEKYLWLNDYKGAILDFTNSIKFGNDNDSETYYLRGDAKCKLNDYRGSIIDYDVAIEIETSRMNNLESEDGYEARGYAKLMLEDIEGAKNDFTKSVDFNSENSRSYYLRGYCEIILKEIDNGCLDFSKAGELGYSDAYDMIEKFCK